MAATAVQSGTVKVVVTEVPLFGWTWWALKHTVTIERADFVGMTVADVIQQVGGMRRWTIIYAYILNGEALNQGTHNTVLRPGDELVLKDP